MPECVCVHMLVCSGLGSSDEMRLIQYLFKEYNPLIRPVRNLTGTVHVKFGMAMIQLINVVSRSHSRSPVVSTGLRVRRYEGYARAPTVWSWGTVSLFRQIHSIVCSEYHKNRILLTRCRI